jgi:subfamily B ATP-binding cassette protein MsbA
MKQWWKNTRDLIACLHRIRPHLRAGRNLVGAVVLSSMGAAALEGVGVGMLVPLLNLLMSEANAKPMRPIAFVQGLLPGHGHSFYIVIFCVLVILAITAKNFALYGSSVLSARLQRRLATNLRESLYRRLLGATMHVFEQRTAGEMANAFGVETYRTLTAFGSLLFMVQRGCMLVCYFGAILVISWQLTLITMLLGLLIGLTVAFLARRLHQHGRELTEANQRLGSHLVESFSGVRVIKATHSLEREVKRFSEISESQASVEERSTRSSSLFLPLSEVVAVTGAMAIVGMAYFFFVRSGTMLSSHLFGFGFILLRVLPLLNQLYSMQGSLAYFAAGVREVERWLDSPQHPHRPFGQREFVDVQDAIRFENIGFAYPNGTVALSKISLSLPAGKTVALVGASGSGKTTVASLLLRFRHPSEGQISVDGIDFWEFTPSSWHKAVAIVEQEAFLFHDSMEQNIAYGFPSVTREEILEAVRKAHLEDVINALPEGLQTVVGERGMMLSGGQRQRLAIARALVRNPRILVLDEATSALDTVSERQVQTALNDAVKGRTVLIIAHRLSTIRNADHVVVLDRGRVVEQGSWSELEARDGAFAQLLKSASTASGVIR